MLSAAGAAHIRIGSQSGGLSAVSVQPSASLVIFELKAES